MVELTWRFDCNICCISKRLSENNVPDCCDTTVEDASSIEDVEGVSVVLLSIARIVPTTTAAKWLCCKLLTETARKILRSLRMYLVL